VPTLRVLNQVQRAYNGLGQVKAEYQEHDGAVDAATPQVQYAYSSATYDSSVLTGITYPSGKVVTYNYGDLNGHGLRVNSVQEGGRSYAFSYLGWGTLVAANYTSNTLRYSLLAESGESVGEGGDLYRGLDRFGRVTQLRWFDGAAIRDHFQYGHDRNGNVLYRTNASGLSGSANQDELYHADTVADVFDGSGLLVSGAYDKLNRLVEFQRGNSSASVGSVPNQILGQSRRQEYGQDAQSNFSSVSTDGASVGRTHDQRNRVTGVGAATLTADAAGNTTTDELGQQYRYDAWGRLVEVKSAGGVTLQAEVYDALGRRVAGVQRHPQLCALVRTIPDLARRTLRRLAQRRALDPAAPPTFGTTLEYRGTCHPAAGP